jgi:DNA-binding NarL/FixJ family response regulator
VVAHQLKSRSLSESDRSRSSDETGHAFVVAVAILSADPVLRLRLEQLPQYDPTVTVVGIVGHSSDLLNLVSQRTIDVVVMDDPTHQQLEQWKRVQRQTPLLEHDPEKWVPVFGKRSCSKKKLERGDDSKKSHPALVLLQAGGSKDAGIALNAGATAVLNRSATRRKIAAAIVAAATGLVVLQPEHLGQLVDSTPLPAESRNGTLGAAQLTPRELEVLAAMADGASNKAIARRLGISFSTVKFHVASILAKLDADSRTEAVMKAAQSGLVML